MKRSAACCTMLVLCLVAITASAATRRVSPSDSCHTLNCAYTIANPGDTILVSAGTYNESLTSAKRLTIIGAGMDLTIVNGTVTLNAGADGSILEGLRLQPGGVVLTLGSGVDSIVIRRTFLNQTYQASCLARSGTGRRLLLDDCIVRNAGNALGGYILMALNGDTVVVRNTIFAGVNLGSGAWGAGNIAVSGACGGLTLQNCCFTGLWRFAALSGSFPLLAVNNIFYDWTPDWGTYPSNSTWAYNACSGSVPPGTDALVLSGNPFVTYDPAANFDYGTSNLRLVAGSICTDAGDPNQHDLDGSRSDLGVYGGQHPFLDSGAPAYPFVSSFTVPPSVTVGNQLPIESQGRIGRGY